MQTVMADWQGTLRLRLGYTRENWLAYITGGAAVSRVKFETSFTDTYLAPLGASSQSSTAKTKVGWALGVGAEHALTKRLAIRGEYLYADFGNIDTQSVVSNQLAPGLSSILTNSTDFRTHTLSIALMYRFQ
jgi:outer membrane autotransporter protein